MYNILIKDTTTEKYSLLKVKKEITETKEVTDDDGNITSEEVGTGEYETVTYETDDKDELKEKCIELLETYPSGRIIPIENQKYNLDITWA